MGNRVECDQCLDNWIALEPIITCFDPNGCLNAQCCSPDSLPPPGQPPGYSEICCTRCTCFDGRPIYLPQLELTEDSQNKLKQQPCKSQINHHPESTTLGQQMDLPSSCYLCLRLGQVCCCPVAGCCLGGGYSIFQSCMACGIGFTFCQGCLWSSLSCLALCHCQYCFFTKFYADSCRKYCILGILQCICCPVESVCSYCKVCGYTCSQNITSFQQINPISHSVSDYCKKALSIDLAQPDNSLKSFQP